MCVCWGWGVGGGASGGGDRRGSFVDLGATDLADGGGREGWEVWRVPQKRS